MEEAYRAASKEAKAVWPRISELVGELHPWPDPSLGLSNLLEPRNRRFLPPGLREGGRSVALDAACAACKTEEQAAKVNARYLPARIYALLALRGAADNRLLLQARELYKPGKTSGDTPLTGDKCTFAVAQYVRYGMEHGLRTGSYEERIIRAAIRQRDRHLVVVRRDGEEKAVGRFVSADANTVLAGWAETGRPAGAPTAAAAFQDKSTADLAWYKLRMAKQLATKPQSDLTKQAEKVASWVASASRARERHRRQLVGEPRAGVTLSDHAVPHVERFLANGLPGEYTAAFVGGLLDAADSKDAIEKAAPFELLGDLLEAVGPEPPADDADSLHDAALELGGKVRKAFYGPPARPLADLMRAVGWWLPPGLGAADLEGAAKMRTPDEDGWAALKEFADAYTVGSATGTLAAYVREYKDGGGDMPALRVMWLRGGGPSGRGLGDWVRDYARGQGEEDRIPVIEAALRGWSALAPPPPGVKAKKPAAGGGGARADDASFAALAEKVAEKGKDPADKHSSLVARYFRALSKPDALHLTADDKDDIIKYAVEHHRDTNAKSRALTEFLKLRDMPFTADGRLSDAARAALHTVFPEKDEWEHAVKALRGRYKAISADFEAFAAKFRMDKVDDDDDGDGAELIEETLDDLREPYPEGLERAIALRDRLRGMKPLNPAVADLAKLAPPGKAAMARERASAAVRKYLKTINLPFSRDGILDDAGVIREIEAAFSDPRSSVRQLQHRYHDIVFPLGHAEEEVAAMLREAGKDDGGDDSVGDDDSDSDGAPRPPPPSNRARRRRAKRRGARRF